MGLEMICDGIMSVAAIIKDDARQRRTESKPEDDERPQITYSRLTGDIAHKVDSLFGIQNCLIEVNPGQVLLPPKYQEMGKQILELHIRPDDTWVVSYPRTGSTWVQEMVWCIGNDLDFEKARTVIQQHRTPMIELSALIAFIGGELSKVLGDSVKLVQEMDSPRFIKTHLPWELLPHELKTVQPKIVYVARNPKDMCVSYYHYCMLVHDLHGSFEDFCEVFLEGKAPIGPIWNHILGFWRRRHEPNILFVKYEDIKKDLHGTIRQTAAFMEKSLSEEQVQELAEHLSFKKMRENPSVNLEAMMALKNGPGSEVKEEIKFLRKGQVGDYRNYMSPELEERFDRWTEENLRGTDLSFEG